MQTGIGQISDYPSIEFSSHDDITIMIIFLKLIPESEKFKEENQMQILIDPLSKIPADF